jgi:hypothetical protein
VKIGVLLIMEKIVFTLLIFLAGTALAETDLSKRSSVYDQLRQTEFPLKRSFPSSQIDWEISPERWLSFPQWEKDLKVREHKKKIQYTGDFTDSSELVGRVIRCVGKCRLYRGLNFAYAGHKSRIREGDEIHTEANSTAWVYLMDGTLVRISSETNIAFNEINISQNKMFIFARLGSGQVYWYPRSPYPYKVLQEPDTDPLMLPLRLVEANLEYVIRKEYDRSSEEEKNAFSSVSATDFLEHFYREINRYVGYNNAKLTKPIPSEHLIVLPNGSIRNQGAAMDLLHLLGGKSYIRSRGAEVERNGPKVPGRAQLFFRGYGNTRSQRIPVGHWMELDPLGESLKITSTRLEFFNQITSLTHYLPSLWMAREILFERFSVPMIKAVSNKSVIEKEYGYKLWQEYQDKSSDQTRESLETRIDFLMGHIRKQETANLMVIHKAMNEKGMSTDFSQVPVDTYNGLAHKAYKQYQNKLSQNLMAYVTMSEAEFIYWILSYAKHSRSFSDYIGKWKSPAQKSFLHSEAPF